MDINRALNLVVGSTVVCPPDRGEPGYTGTVTHEGGHVQKTLDGVEYLWIEVQHPNGTKRVWPSNRLG